MIYGVNPVLEAIKASPAAISGIMLSTGRTGAASAEIVNAARAHGIRMERAEQRELDRIAGTPKHQGVVAYIEGEFPYADLDDLIKAWRKSRTPAFFLILDSIQDPQNLGSLLRAADAAGVHGVVIPKDRATGVTPAVVKASAGAAAHVPVAMVTNLVAALKTLKDEGVWTAAVEADATESIHAADLKSDTAIVIGGEAGGIRRLVREACDYSVSIPMKGHVNSLNAAQAGAITMFEVLRQRNT